ncbi:MAG: sensor histidine kinase [Sphingosinicella sp.]|uniref:sensor histidine kinase n=1 Tax=Sphingosinicella sp. TaxID=1917971 RepID=UPI004037B4D9
MGTGDQERELLQLISEGFIFVDPDFRVLEINAEGLRMARRPRSDFIGRILWDVAPHLRTSALEAIFVKAMRDRQPVSIEHFYTWTDGRQSWLEIRGHRTAGGLAIFYRDISQQKKSAEELARAQAELMHGSRVSAMGTMAATLSHELAQPLTAAGNYIETCRKLLRPIADERAREARRALDQAGGSIRRAIDILERLRAFVSKGRTKAETNDLRAIIADAGVLVLPLAQREGVEIRFHLDDKAHWVRADAVQIQQVLINLIRNAIEAMRDSARKRIAIATSPASGNMVEVSVEDSGPGLGDAAPETVFAPFHSSKPGGLGVGLSISRTIVEAHGGTIVAENSPKGGAVFRFTLPAGRKPD